MEAVYADENVWLTQKMMGLLYDVETHTINYHLKRAFADGKTYDTQHYNLAAIIAVGYKVNSERAVQFRKWATGIIESFTIKGFAMDDEHLKNDGSILTKQYFEEQLQMRNPELKNMSHQIFLRSLRNIAFFCALAWFAEVAGAQDLEMISNTNQPLDGFVDEVYGARAVFSAGFDAGGYQLNGFSIELGDNASVTHGPLQVFLFGSNDPFNLDNVLSDFYVTAPSAPGFYYFAWPTNIYIPPQYSDTDIYYYHILIAPTVIGAGGDELNVAYTTSTATNYSFNNAWTFYPEASNINGWVGYYSLVNIYATVLPPPVVYPIHLRDVAVLADDSFQFGFTNSPSLSFSVHLTTNAALPFPNWIYAGPANNIVSNYFQYNTGPGVVHNPAYPRTIFFRVSSP